MDKDRHNKAWLIPMLTGTTFFYFLIFAQFGYLHLLAEGPYNSSATELILLFMGIGGVIGSILAATRMTLEKAATFLITGYAGMGIAAYLSALVSSLFLQGLVSLTVGLSLGLVTVTVVPVVRALTAGKNIAWHVSTGVGAAYFVCNLPFIFNASPWNQGILAAAASCAGIGTVMLMPKLSSYQLTQKAGGSEFHPHLFQPAGIAVITAMFTVLIWYDSAAFYLIQGTEPLKLSTWSGEFQLMLIAVIHLVCALVAGKLLDKGGILPTLVISTAMLLAGYSIMRYSPGLSGIAALIYAGGVSAYSCALVSYGALAAERKGKWGVAMRAGTVFAIGGWIGSGMGIGMAKDLEVIPVAFVLILLAVFFGGLEFHRRALNSTAAVAG